MTDKEKLIENLELAAEIAEGMLYNKGGYGGAYEFWLDNLLLPITPSKMKVNIKNRNTTVDLVNGDEINILRKPGLTEIEFEFRLPASGYYYLNSLYTPAMVLKRLEKMKNRMRTSLRTYSDNALKTDFLAPVIFRVITNDNRIGYYTKGVSIEDYSIVQDASKGKDITVSIRLKDYKYYRTIVYKEVKPDKPAQTATERPVSDNNPNSNTTPAGTKHVVKGGENFSDLCLRYMRDGSKAMTDKMYQKNKATMDDWNKKNGQTKYPKMVYSGEVLYFG